MAEYVIGHIIAHERNFAGMREKQQSKEYCQ
jgi:phosphoglycerate dehydrogenase-like enzyme